MLGVTLGVGAQFSLIGLGQFLFSGFFTASSNSVTAAPRRWDRGLVVSQAPFLSLKRVVRFPLVVGLFFGSVPKNLWTTCMFGFRASRLKVSFKSGKFFHSDQPEIQDSVKSTGRSLC